MKAIKPFVKWAGGKGGLLSQLETFYPVELSNKKIKKYVEPFCRWRGSFNKHITRI